MRHKLNEISAGIISRVLSLFPGHLPVVYKIALFITGLIVFCSVTLSGILIYGQARIMEDQINDFGNTIGSHLARAVQEPLLAKDKLAMGLLVSSLVSGRSVIGSEILSPTGEILVGSGLSPFSSDGSNLKISPVEIIRQAETRQRWLWQLTIPDEMTLEAVSFVSPIRFENVTAGYALVTFSQKTLGRSLRKAVVSIAFTTGLIIFLGIVMAYVLSRRISKPVKHFMKAIEAFDKGDYNYRFNERRRDEIGQLMVAFDQMAEGMAQKNQVERALDRYLSPKIARQVVTNLDSVKLGGKRVVGSVLFADIVGFTRMSESMDPEGLAEILNRFFSLITWAGALNMGTVDKFMGDCVMLVFGALEEDKEHAFHAARCSLLIRRLVDHENGSRVKKGLAPIDFRVGLNGGSMLAGNMGSMEKMEYTVVGDTVNLASRLCSIAEANQIVVSKEFYDQENIRRKVVSDEHIPMQLRGMEGVVETFLLKGLVEAEHVLLEEQFETIIKQSIV